MNLNYRRFSVDSNLIQTLMTMTMTMTITMTMTMTITMTMK